MTDQPQPTPTPMSVFYSYAHEDEALRDELEKHLSLLQRRGFITGWHDRQIVSGTDWAQAIDSHLNEASIILLLISASFLASDYCYHTEMKRALERHEAGEARVIPIILRPVNWEAEPSLSKLQALPAGAKPVTTWPNPPTYDEAFLDIEKGIRQVVLDLNATQTIIPRSSLRPWNVPFPRNPFFTGREDILKHLHDTLTKGKTAALTQPPQAISGLGGIGKTQTAVEYAYRYGDEYQYVFWVQSEKREELNSSFVKIAELLNLSEKNAQDQSKSVAAVKRWLQEHTGWLLILDNADDLELAREFIPTASKGHILLTTRAQSMGRLAQKADVEKMESEEGALFLLRRASIIGADAPLADATATDRAKAREIVEAVDGLPLALDQAGAYIEETGCGLAGYLSRYNTQHSQLLKRRGGLVPDHREPVASTWKLSFQKVEQANPAAADLLRLCAFLAPDAIPEQIITEGAPDLTPELQAIASNPLDLDAAIEELLKYSLVYRDPADQTLSTHRLVQAVLKDEMDEQTQRSAQERVIRAIDRAFPKDSRSKIGPDRQRYSPQVLAGAGLIEQWNIILPEAVRLLYRAGDYLNARSQYQEAEAILKQAVFVSERAHGRMHQETAESFVSLASVYMNQGKSDEAEPFFQQALEIWEQVLGPEHLKTAACLNALANVHRWRREYEQAESLIKRALAIYEREVRPNHPRLTKAFLDLAELYLDQGQHEQAEQLMKRISVSLEQDLDHAEDKVEDKVAMLFSTASLYMRQGEYEQAEPLFKQVLKIWEPLQEMDPWLAMSLNHLGDIYISQDKDEQAEQLYLRALKIWEQIKGPGGRDTWNSLNGLARIYIKQDKYEQAIAVHTRIISLAPNNAASYLDRGYMYLRLKNSEEACTDFARCAALQPKNVNAAWMVVYTSLSKQCPGVDIAERLEAIAELDSKSDEACVCRGVALRLRGKQQEGLAELEHALSLDAENEDAWFWKGMICACLGRNATAVESIEQALKAGLPPILLILLCWLEQDSPNFYQEYAEPLLKRYELL